VPQYAGRQKIEFEQAIVQLNTPETVNVWLVENFTYDVWLLVTIAGIRFNEDALRRYVIKYPISTYFDKKGLCHDAANLAGYALTKAGYKVQIVTAIRKAPFKIAARSHTVCTFEKDKKWWVCGDTRGRKNSVIKDIAGPFENLEGVATYAVDDNLREYHFARKKGF